VRLTENRNTRSEQLLVMPTVANQQRMASRKAFEWIGTSKAQLVFRYYRHLFFIFNIANS